MKNIIYKAIAAIMSVFICSHSVAEENCEIGWQNSFYKYPAPRRINAPNGFLIKSAPCVNSRTIKKLYEEAVVIGHLEVNGNRFYLTKWSWSQAKKGKNPNWILITGNPERGASRWYNEWMRQFTPYDYPKEIFTNTYRVKKIPNTYANDIKISNRPENIIVIGHLDNEDGRFYMTRWSLSRIRDGIDPNWVYIPNSQSVHEPKKYPYLSYMSQGTAKDKIFSCSKKILAQGIVNKVVPDKKLASVINRIITSVVHGEIDAGSMVAAGFIAFIGAQLRSRGFLTFATIAQVGGLALEFSDCMADS